MTKLLFTIAVFCCGLSLLAQPVSEPVKYFVVKGKVEKHKNDFWEIGITHFMGFKTVSIPIEKDGSFYKIIPIERTTDIALMFDHSILLFAVPGDTININWNDTDVPGTIKLLSSKAGRQTELNLMLGLSKNLMFHISDLTDTLQDKAIAQSVKFEQFDKSLSADLKFALSYPITSNSNKLFADIYFRYINSLFASGLLNKFSLPDKSPLSKQLIDSLVKAKVVPSWRFDFNFLDEQLFGESASYRDFIYDRLRLTNMFNGAYAFKRTNTNWTLNNCYSGMAELNEIPFMRDWYLAKTIIDGFSVYSFEGSEEAYQQFFPKITTGLFRDTLHQFYEGIQRLRPGQPAPGFTLKDIEGKNVSLSDLKGKVILLDFWGVYCGPCIYNIKNTMPKLHDRYKGKDVVFVNLCVDVNTGEWKQGVKKLSLGGVNLIAEGWTINPVCVAYNINALPHYVLIDQKGNIANPNLTDLDGLLVSEENEIDKLLK
jgi:thiol-disulfide isomerase/thioredoxin